MSMTWRDVKLATLQKMFAAEGSTIPTDESTVDYLAGMPYVANEALQRLSTAGKFLTKSIVIAHNPLFNQLDDLTAYAIHSIGYEAPFIVGGVGTHSYYFEFSGKGTLTISVNGTILTTISLDAKGTYKAYRGLIESNADYTDNVELSITANYPSTVKNMALYAEQFDTEDEVPTFARRVRYNLRELTDDFYNMSDNQIYYEGGLNPEYLQTSDYYRESDKIVLLDRDKAGSYTIYYHAYPPEITLATEDDYELPLDKDLVVLMPLYMASQLYKDDDNAIATTYRNEFEVGIDSLRDTSLSVGLEHFTSETGWV